MNESEKNIETCLPENILAEVASVPTDPQFVSLVEESFDPMQQQAVQQAGSDAYNEVVASHQPYTFASFIRQMKSNLILLLRRLWRFPFGSGTIRSLSDMWEHYITRLQGSETYGIQSRLDQLTDLPSAPLLVADRKIGGVPEAEDGMSMARILCDSAYAATITEITDDTTGYTYTRQFPWSTFPNIKKAVLNFVSTDITIISGHQNIEELVLPAAEVISRNQMSYTFISNCPKLKKIDGKAFKRFSSSNGTMMIRDCAALEEIDFRNSTSIGTYVNIALICNCPSLRKIIIGTTGTNPYDSNTDNLFGSPNYQASSTANLVHLELGEGFNYSLNTRQWSPTNALDPTGTDLVEDPTAHPTWNNLQQFLQNFRSFIVLRLANRKSTTALTLTLSANVYNAVTGANSGWASQHTLAELGITDNDLTDLETELGITSATIYATWLDTYTGANGIHWDINKAN